MKTIARVIVNGYMQSQGAWMTALASKAPVSAQRDLAEMRHAFDVRVHRRRMFAAMVGVEVGSDRATRSGLPCAWANSRQVQLDEPVRGTWT